MTSASWSIESTIHCMPCLVLVMWEAFYVFNQFWRPLVIWMIIAWCLLPVEMFLENCEVKLQLTWSSFANFLISSTSCSQNNLSWTCAAIITIHTQSGIVGTSHASSCSFEWRNKNGRSRGGVWIDFSNDSWIIWNLPSRQLSTCRPENLKFPNSLFLSRKYF